MSYDWTTKKIDDPRVLHLENSQYAQIEKIIDSGDYRAVLWNLKVETDRIFSPLGNAKIEAGDVMVSPTAVGDATDPLALPANTVRFGAPRNAFARSLLRWYEEELGAIGPRPLN
jgi:hypothetical protein